MPSTAIAERATALSLPYPALGGKLPDRMRDIYSLRSSSDVRAFQEFLQLAPQLLANNLQLCASMM